MEVPEQSSLSEPASEVGRHFALLVCVCAAWSVWQWLRLPTLMYGDNLRWMLEAKRASAGEIIYRDFASMYPPLGIFTAALFYRLFGPTFAATNGLIDFLSLATVLVTWQLARRLLSPRIALGSSVVLACLGATNAGSFALFSLTLYTPSILLGAIGLALTLIGVCDSLDSRKPIVACAYVAVGVTIAALSKLEHAVAAAAAFALMAIYELTAGGARLSVLVKKYAFLGAAATLPSIAVYTLIMRRAGVDNLTAGLSGYGVAAQFCPAWPTGLGALGALAAIGQAGVLTALLILYYGRFSSISFACRAWCIATVVTGICLWTLNLPYAVANFYTGQPNLSGTKLIIAYCFSMTGLLTPFMWLSILLAFGVGRRVFFGLLRRSASSEEVKLLAVSGALFVLTSRGMFGHMFGNVTIVHQSSYPLLVTFAAYLAIFMQRTVDKISSGETSSLMAAPGFKLKVTSRAASLLGVLALVSTAPRIARALTRTRAVSLRTLAGHVYVEDGPSFSAYEYVLNQTRPNDAILELPLGGGLAFASHRRAATFSTQFLGLLTPPRLMQLDLTRLKADPPRLVMGFDDPSFGATYGICAPCGCTFPRLVWRSDKLACDPKQELSAVGFVNHNYRFSQRFGSFIMLSPNS